MSLAVFGNAFGASTGTGATSIIAASGIGAGVGSITGSGSVGSALSISGSGCFLLYDPQRLGSWAARCGRQVSEPAR
jgi:hypothetical protein